MTAFPAEKRQVSNLPELGATNPNLVEVSPNDSQLHCGAIVDAELPGGPPRPTIEIWREVPGFGDHYEASTWGRVRRRGAAQCLTAHLTADGYHSLALYAEGRSHQKQVHTLVMLAFVGGRPDGCTVNHIDAIKTHNWLSNLEYMTRAENIRQAYRDGMYSSKLTPENILEIRKLLGTATKASIGRRFSVSPTTIRRIAEGIAWRRLP